LGFEEAEFLGQDVSIIFTPEDRERDIPNAERVQAINEGRAEDTRWHLRKDETRFFANGLAMPIKDDNGNIVFFTKILRDETARKQMEEEREELLKRERKFKEAVENAYVANNEFLRLLSHELRNPLNSILGWTNILRSSNLTSEQANKAIETIERNGKLQARLIEDVFDLSRLTTGKLQLSKAEMDLTEAVKQTVDSILPTANEKNINLKSQINSEAILFTGDVERIQQSVSNLLTNAVKFTEEGGCIDVSLKKLESAAQIIIKDNGRGISPEYLPHIFTPYYQANNNLDSKENGLGLGLALVKNLIEMHGGTVMAESDGIGKGATFTVTIPLLSVK
jgi:PAS domain S-box-containing protein